MGKRMEKLTNTIDLATKKIKGLDNWQEYREELNEVFGKIGFTYLAKGLHRVVFLSKTGKYIVKFDKSASQNKPEIEAYAKIPKKLKKYFLKPIAHDKKNFRWILTHKAKTLDNDDLTRTEANDIVRKLNKIFNKHKIDVGDLHNSNVGLYKNKPVMIDYGWSISGLGGDN